MTLRISGLNVYHEAAHFTTETWNCFNWKASPNHRKLQHTKRYCYDLVTVYELQCITNHDEFRVQHVNMQHKSTKKPTRVQTITQKWQKSLKENVMLRRFSGSKTEAVCFSRDNKNAPFSKVTCEYWNKHQSAIIFSSDRGRERQAAERDSNR